MTREIRTIAANMDAVYGRLSGRDAHVEIVVTIPQAVLGLGLLATGFFARILSDPLFTAQVSLQDVSLVAAIWLVWAAAITTVIALTRIGGKGGADVIGLSLAGAAVTLVDYLTPGFLLPVTPFVLIQLGLALFALSRAFRLVPQIVPGGATDRWAARFGTHALPVCALILFVASTPLSGMVEKAGAQLGQQRAEVAARRAAEGGAPRLREAAVFSLAPSTAVQAVVNASASAAQPQTAENTAENGAVIHRDARAALALLLLAVHHSSGATQASW
ncbi:MAG: hypothetical protein ACWA5A_03985 [Marinibacterium sp.]